MIIDEFIVRALIAGILVVMVTGPMGCVVVWRRMAYFGDALAHSALLGAALAVMVDVSAIFGVIFIGVLISYLLLRLQLGRELSSDTILGILSHGALAAGLVILALMQSQGQSIDLMAYLFGDILSVSWSYLIGLSALCLFALIVLLVLWQSMLSIAVNEELARSEGVRVDRVRLAFMLLMALMVAVAMKIVGIILITALLIIPAASARRFAQSPEGMAGLAVGFGIVSVLLGIMVSMLWDTPAGPSIVLSAVLLFFVSRLKKTSEQYAA